MGETPEQLNARRGWTHATGCLHSDRQQRVVDLDHVAAIQADLRFEPRGGAEGRAVRVRFRAVDDQAARFRRAVAVLGLQPRIVHADGRAGVGDKPHSAVRHLRRPDSAAADRRPHGGDDQLDLARTVRRQHHLRLAAPRIHADGHLAGRGTLPPALRVLRRIRQHHARAVGDRPLGFQGRLLPNGRLPLSAAADRKNPDHLRRAERRRHALCRGVRGLQFLHRRRRQPADERSRRASRVWSKRRRRPAATAAR